MQDFKCSNCGHDVRVDGCGFLYSDNKILECMHCPDPSVIGYQTKVLDIKEPEQLELPGIL